MPEVQEDTQQQAAPDFSTQMQQAIWEDKPIPQQQASPDSNTNNQSGNGGEQTPSNQAAPAPANEEILDTKEWLKREFEVDDPQAIKQQLAELKELREKASTPQEIKFANELSEKVYKALQEENGLEAVYTHLDEKRRLDRLTSSEVSKQAEEIIKYGMSLKNKGLEKEDINFLYNKKYSLPPKPVKDIADDENDYAAKVSEWEGKVNEIKREIEIEAKMILPELQKMKSELVFPDIKPKNDSVQQQPSQEDIDKANKFKESFLAEADKSVKEFPGFSTTVEEKDFKLAVNYGLSTEQKSFIDSKLKEFAESNFNANALFAQDWVNKDGTLNVSKMTKDLSLIYFGEDMHKKNASEGANQRLEQYIKEKKNLNLNGGQAGAGQFSPEKKNQSEQLQEKFWAN